MNAIRKFIIVDDDSFNNLLCKIIIEDALGNADINTFNRPEEALGFIREVYSSNNEPTILFLDINMPTLTGWDFIEAYEKFSDTIKEQIRIYILSSSVDQRDKDKAAANKYIKGFFSKALENEMVISVAGNP